MGTRQGGLLLAGASAGISLEYVRRWLPRSWLALTSLRARSGGSHFRLISIAFGKAPPAPAYLSYVEDVVFGARWRWSWRGGEIEHLWVFCIACQGELVYVALIITYTQCRTRNSFVSTAIKFPWTFRVEVEIMPCPP